MIFDTASKVRKIVPAIYDCVTEARLSAGQPQIYLINETVDSEGNEEEDENKYSLDEIKSGRLPSVSKVQFEFRSGNYHSVLTVLADGKYDTHNFLDADELKLDEHLQKINLVPIAIKPPAKRPQVSASEAPNLGKQAQHHLSDEEPLDDSQIISLALLDI